MESAEILRHLYKRATFRSALLDQGFIIDRKIEPMKTSQSEPSENETPFLGVQAADSQLHGRTLRKMIDNDMVGPCEGMRIRLVEGVTGSGKSHLLGMYYNQLQYARQFEDCKVLSTPVIPCHPRQYDSVSYSDQLTSKIVFELHACYRANFADKIPEHHLRWLQAIIGIDKWNALDNYCAEQMLISRLVPIAPVDVPTSNFNDFVRYISAFGAINFRIIILLDEFSTYWDMIKSKEDKKELIERFFRQLPQYCDDMRTSRHVDILPEIGNVVFIGSILPEHYREMMMTSDQHETGLFRRTGTDRLLLGDFTLRETDELMKLLVRQFVQGYCGLSLSDSRTLADELARAIRSKSPGSALRSAVGEIWERYNLSSTKSSTTDYYEKVMTKTPFLEKVRELCATVLNNERMFGLGKYESRFPSHPHKWDHHYCIRTHRRSFYFYGETSVSHLDTNKYRNAYFPLLNNIVDENLNQTEFLILLTPTIEDRVHPILKQDKVHHVLVPLERHTQPTLSKNDHTPAKGSQEQSQHAEKVTDPPVLKITEREAQKTPPKIDYPQAKTTPIYDQNTKPKTESYDQRISDSDDQTITQKNDDIVVTGQQKQDLNAKSEKGHSVIEMVGFIKSLLPHSKTRNGTAFRSMPIDDLLSRSQERYPHLTRDYLIKIIDNADDMELFRRDQYARLQPGG